MSDYSDEDVGLDIRPPQPGLPRVKVSSSKFSQKDRSSSGKSREYSRGHDRRDGRDRERTRERRDRDRDRHHGSRRDEGSKRSRNKRDNDRLDIRDRQVDLRERLKHRSKDEYRSSRSDSRRDVSEYYGASHSQAYGNYQSNDRRRDDRSRKIVYNERNRRDDEEERRRRKEILRERIEHEKKIKRKREKAEHARKKKRRRDRHSSNDSKTESGENVSYEEEEEEEESQEEGETDGEASTSEATASNSNRSESVSEQSEEELSEESIEEKPKESPSPRRNESRELSEGEHVDSDDPEGRWKDEEEVEDDPVGRWKDESINEEKTESSPINENVVYDEEEDEEDSQLEAALRGELKDKLPQTKENTPQSQKSFGDNITSDKEEEPTKQITEEEKQKLLEEEERKKLPPYLPSVYGCRSVERFRCLNRIAEGTYGVVYRAKDKQTSEIVALKKLKMEKEKEGFPITSLREINTLLISQHPNVVTVREIVVGHDIDQIYIVMDFVEHDLKSLMETMVRKKTAFRPEEIKCLMIQLLKAIAHLHDNWILHRDLKTSNLLLSHNGILKVGDFGLAREYGSPLKPYTAVVVTLWYRAPELLLGQKEYSTHIDTWSVGCILGELMQMTPLFCGKSEQDQLHKIFQLLGTPSEKIWPDYNSLPLVKDLRFVNYPISNLRRKFSNDHSDQAFNLLKALLTYDPKRRLSCEEALKHNYFQEKPLPIDPRMLPSWPAKSELSAAERANMKKLSSPKPPSGGGAFKKMNDDDKRMGAKSDYDFVSQNSANSAWQLKF